MLKGLRSAAEYAKVSHQTISNWHHKYGVGQFIDGDFYVTMEDLAPFIEASKLKSLANEKMKTRQR